MRLPFALALLASVAGSTVSPALARPDAVAAALADKTRPDADRAQDEGRKPAAILAFAGFKPGNVVVDWGAGGGYYTRLIADMVGPKGRVYALGDPRFFKAESWDGLTAAHPNVAVQVALPAAQALAPRSLDAIFAHLEFHDLYLPAEKDGANPAQDVPARLRNWFAALRPGGTVTIVDHVGPAGEPAVVAGTLHRIDPARVRADMEAAGFEFVGESAVLHRNDDPHSAIVFDPSVRGKTDRFALKFRRPV
ncbi:MAG: hypothetical protein RIS94_119 [Pseudomonadota bacterium]|jgi:predicted methyltransferase